MPAPAVITDAQESLEDQLRRRQIRYLVMMGIRAACLIAAAVLVSTRPPLLGLWLTLCVLGVVLLPWLAVLLANDRPAKTRAERRATRRGPRGPGPAPRSPMIEARGPYTVIDGEHREPGPETSSRPDGRGRC